MTITVKILADQDPMNPRDGESVGDRLAIMACWHKRYTLGDVQPSQDPEEWLATNAPKGSVVLALHLYDHGSITMRTKPFDDHFDSGQVGYIVATPESIRRCFNRKLITAKLRATVEAQLKAEVAEYDAYLTGDVWGFIVESDDDPSLNDSCWGFFGSDKSTLALIQWHAANAEIKAAMADAWEYRT